MSVSSGVRIFKKCFNPRNTPLAINKSGTHPHTKCLSLHIVCMSSFHVAIDHHDSTNLSANECTVFLKDSMYPLVRTWDFNKFWGPSVFTILRISLKNETNLIPSHHISFVRHRSGLMSVAVKYLSEFAWCQSCILFPHNINFLMFVGSCFQFLLITAGRYLLYVTNEIMFSRCHNFCRLNFSPCHNRVHRHDICRRLSRIDGGESQRRSLFPGK